MKLAVASFSDHPDETIEADLGGLRGGLNEKCHAPSVGQRHHDIHIVMVQHPAIGVRDAELLADLDHIRPRDKPGEEICFKTALGIDLTAPKRIDKDDDLRSELLRHRDTIGNTRFDHHRMTITLAARCIDSRVMRQLL